MKKINLFTLILSFVAFVAFALPLRADDGAIKVSSDPWEPWVLGTEGNVASGGMAVEYINEIFNRIGVKSETIIYPYERCLAQMKSGERDMILMAKKTPEREQYMVYSDVAATDPQLLYFSTEHMNDLEWNEWKDLKQYTIGGVQGFNYGDLENAVKEFGIKTEFTATDNQNIKKLLSGRIDAVILSRSTANYYMEQNPETKGKLKAAKRVIADAEYYFALSKKGNAAKYVSQINEKIREMKNDGTADKILGIN